ncbi:MAG: glycosyltransferase family protein, partial [Acidobacteriota bacterium]
MKIVYGVQGYGRGHVSRALAIIPHLIQQGHKVRIFAGGAAYEFLKISFDATEIPFLSNHYHPGDGQPSFWLTVGKLLPPVGQLFLGAVLGIKTGSFRRVYDDIKKFDPDLVVTDFENWTRVAGNRLGVPVVSLDHASIIAYC